jgi:hypothetical protein
MLGGQGLWLGRDLYRATPTVIRELGFSGLISCYTYCDTGTRFFRSHPKDRPFQSPFTTHEGMWRIYSSPDPHGTICMEMLPFPVKGCKIWAYARRSGPLSRKGSLSCHTCCDTGPRLFRSRPKNRPIQSPLMTHKGVWRISSRNAQLFTMNVKDAAQIMGNKENINDLCMNTIQTSSKQF